MWLADDGKVPTHLPFLTPKLASQITQVWAISLDTFRTPQQIWQNLPAPEEPDFDPPLHPSPQKRARKVQDHNRLHYGNVTNFGRQVIDWYWTREGDAHVFAETHPDPQTHHEICQYFTIRGRTVFGIPAWPNKDNAGTHGGILVLADPSMHHVKALHTLYQAWPTELPHLEQAWRQIHEQLVTKIHPWYTVKGPLAATIAYLAEWKWQASTFHRRTRQANDYMLENEISLQDP